MARRPQNSQTRSGDFAEAHLSDQLMPNAARYFLEVSRSLSIRQAADRLSIAPSAISRQLSKLEADLNTVLLERRPEGVVLTEAGEVLRDHLNSIQSQVERFTGDIADLSASRRGTVRIATVEGITRPFMSEQISRFREAHPAVTFRLRSRGRQMVIESLEQRLSHIGFLYDHFSHPALLEVGRWRQPLLALARPDHPLTKRSNLQLSDLVQFACILPDETYGIHHIVKRAFARVGAKPICNFLSDNLAVLCDNAQRSGAITFLPLQAATMQVIDRQLAPLDLQCADFRHRYIYAVVRREQVIPPAASAFLEQVVQAFKEGEQQDRDILASLSLPEF
jgi:Transcriptional regulator